MNPLRLGTRGSALALWQANAVAARVRGGSGRACDLVVITTTGDRLREANLSQVGGKQVFVKEIEHALIRGDIDLAVHSAKDMPGELPDGLEIAAVLPRADPRDAVVLPAGTEPPSTLSAVGRGGVGNAGPRVGSGSVRRVAQLRRAWPRAEFRLVRGNVGTRLRKLDAGDYDLLVLAVAGLERLGLADRISMPIDADTCLPAPGQGIVAVETRAGDAETGDALAAVKDAPTHAAFTAERSLVAALGGGCHAPIGALAEGHGGRLRLRAMVASLDGTQRLCREADMPADAARTLGMVVARSLLADGAGPMLEAAQRAAATGHAKPGA